MIGLGLVGESGALPTLNLINRNKEMAPQLQFDGQVHSCNMPSRECTFKRLMITRIL